MPGAPITDAEVQHAAEAITKAGRSWNMSDANMIGAPALSKLLNISRMRATNILARLRGTEGPLQADRTVNPTDAPFESQERQQTETDEVKGDQRTYTKIVHERIRTLDDLIRVCEIDTAEWEVERYVVNKWEGFNVPRATRPSGSAEWVRPDTTPVITELFQVKAWMKRNRPVLFAREQIEILKREAANFIAPIYPPMLNFKGYKKTGNLAEFSLVDHHFGALIWGKETGSADYDLKIAKSTYEKALGTLIARLKVKGGIDEAMLVIGNDQHNTDNRLGTTEKGTPQSNDGRQQKVFQVSKACTIWGIEALRSVAPKVRVVVVPGNHDYMTSYYLGDTIESWFRRCPGVTVDNSPNPKKYYEHGNVMLMFGHGNTGKLEDYDRTMAAEQPAMWGRTLWREAHTADKHQRRLIELKGATVRILPSLRPPCGWSAENHHVGAVRAAESYLWHCEDGLVTIETYSVLKDKAEAA